MGDFELSQAVVSLLRDRGLQLAVAESLTGGLLSTEIVSVPGASDVYRGGVTTYAPDTKVHLLGVERDLVAEGGTVQRSIAGQMAQGARSLFAADVALATTGVAGPGPSEGHPAGTVFVALASSSGIVTDASLFTGDRLQVREKTVQLALNMLRRWLESDA